jgi:hypothetical protein
MGMPLVDYRMQEWGMADKPSRIRDSALRILSELNPEGLMALKDPRFEVMVLPPGAPPWHINVWAYFPIDQRRWIAKELKPKPQTRVLLVINSGEFEKAKAGSLDGKLRDHLGHVLLFLRAPAARNECRDAWKEWESYALRRRPNSTKPGLPREGDLRAECLSQAMRKMIRTGRTPALIKDLLARTATLLNRFPAA